MVAQIALTKQQESFNRTFMELKLNFALQITLKT